jgi:hypothetical protein
MLILGVPYAPLLGVLAFILEFIPTIGTIVTGFVAVVIALTVSWQLALITMILHDHRRLHRGQCALATHYGQSGGDPAGGVTAGNDCRVRGVWHLGCDSGGTDDGSDPGIGAYWQYYQKTYTEEFPLEKLEQAANSQDGSTLSVINELAVDEP